jgi:hypothetical protein
MAVRRCRIKRLALGVEAESEIDRVHGPEKRHVDQALVALKYRQAPAFKFNLAVLGKHGATIRTWKAFHEHMIGCLWGETIAQKGG